MLLSKKPELFLPEKWPAYYKKAKGCEIWDIDGKKFFDLAFQKMTDAFIDRANEIY